MPHRPALTDLSLRAATPPEHGAVTVWDGALKHFGLRISKGGARSFIVLLGSGRRQVVGRYPTISLAQARAKAKAMLAERTLGRHQPKSTTWNKALEEYLAAVQHRNRARTHAEYSRTLKRHFAFGNMRLSEITRADIARKLDRLDDVPAQQSRALVYCKILFNWALKRGYVDVNPCVAFVPAKSKPRTRVLSDVELLSIWDATVSPTAFNIIVRLLMLTGQRRGEIAALRPEYFSNDMCTLPAALTKNGREHAFPIRTITQSVLLEGRKHITADRGFLFPGRNNPQGIFNGWSKCKRVLDKASQVTDWTLHDLRRTFATRLAELGVAPHIIERLLNHASGQISGIAAIYNRARYLDEMRVAISHWEEYFTKVIAPQQRAA